MTITFRFNDDTAAEFEIVDDYGMWRYFDLRNKIDSNPKLGTYRGYRVIKKKEAE